MADWITQLAFTLIMTFGFALILVWGRPQAIERRGRNAWVGIRIPSTMTSDAAWKAGHRAAWPAVKLGCWAGILLLLAAAGLTVTDTSSSSDLAVALSFAGMLVALALILVGARSADHAAKEQTSEAK